MALRPHRAMFAVLALFATVAAGMNCSGTITADVDEDVYISGGITCRMEGDVSVTGSVYMSDGANLQTRGTIAIKGAHGIQGVGAGWLELLDNTSVGKVDMLNGTSDSHVSVHGSTIGGGGLKVENCVGNLVICGATLNDVVEFKESKGSFVASANWWAVAGFGCPSSEFESDIKIENITGDFFLSRANVRHGEFTAHLVQGRTIIEHVHMEEATFQLNKGEVRLNHVTTTMVDLKENQSGVKLWNSHFDFLDCKKNVPDVTGYGNTIKKARSQCVAPGLSA